MSWHSGDWANFGIALTSAVAAVAASYAAFQSGRSAKESLRYQRDAVNFERERFLSEMLRSDAARANESVKGVELSQWSFDQVAEIAAAIDSAMNRIYESQSLFSPERIQQHKENFVNQLDEAIHWQLSQESAPDAIFRPKGPAYLIVRPNGKWYRAKEFFGFGAK